MEDRRGVVVVGPVRKEKGGARGVLDGRFGDITYEALYCSKGVLIRLIMFAVWSVFDWAIFERNKQHCPSCQVLKCQNCFVNQVLFFIPSKQLQTDTHSKIVCERNYLFFSLEMFRGPFLRETLQMKYELGID